MSEQRLERDSMGEIAVPAGAYYGAGTQRARENFPISTLRFDRRFIRALGLIKKHGALVNAELGLLDERPANAIAAAAEEVIDGGLDEWFDVDVFQTGSGTSTNMNANEVIANRAIEILGGVVGSRTPVHPNDHVNLGQSSNDVIPTAIHISAALSINDELLPALEVLQQSLRRKADELWPVVKSGRTHLQDATPIRLGQEFLGFAGQIERCQKRCRQAVSDLGEVALGGTAVGTGMGCHPEFSQRVLANISDATGLRLRETDNHFASQSNFDIAAAAGSALRSVALVILKVANDIRLLASGPRTGLGELLLPPVQPGSSIMPGKVNPVIAESAAMVAAKVTGNDATITFAAAAGSQLELNTMMPVVAFTLLESIALLTTTAGNLAGQCVDGITATSAGPELLERNLALCTGLVPRIGYDAAAAIAHEAHAYSRTIREVARERTQLSDDELNELLDATRMTEPRR